MAVLLALAPAAWAQTAQQPAQQGSEPQVLKSKIFPYPIHTRTLANGLAVIVIPTPEFKNMVTFATPVFAGSRNETEKGKTGLAHLFEHIMFRHEFAGKPGGYDEHIRRMGAHNNAYTSYDITFYYPSTFVENLVGPIKRPSGEVAGLIELEAARFSNLTVDSKTFQVEAGAVLGEYRRAFSNPSLAMLEKLGAVAFPDHPYGHTVIGLRQDVENMPQAADAAWEFFRNYYTPNNVALVVAGDVDPQMIFRQVEKHYGDWKPRPAPKIPPTSFVKGEQRVHVPWEADVSPRLMVSWYSPAFQPGNRESAVTMILGELLTSRSAPLFQKLRFKKQTVTSFNNFGLEESVDPHLLILNSELVLDRFKKEGQGYVDDVRQDVIAGVDDLKNFSKQPDAAQTLQVIKSKVRNDLLGSLNSVGSIAQIFSEYYKFDRDPLVFDKMLDALEALTPADIDAYAGKYFTPERRQITTLWGKQSAPAASAEVK